MKRLKLYEEFVNENVEFLSKPEIMKLEKGFRKKVGFTNARVGDSLTRGKLLSVSHGGNMGNSIEKSIDPNLVKMGFPTIADLKKMFPNFKEEGSPDYSYVIEFQINDPK